MTLRVEAIPARYSSPDSTESGTFRDLFCRATDCSPEAFEKELMQRCLFRRARLLYPWIEHLNGDFFFHERRLVEQIAAQESYEGIRYDIDFYQHKFVSTCARRSALRIRLSGQRLLQLVRTIMSNRDVSA